MTVKFYFVDFPGKNDGEINSQCKIHFCRKFISKVQYILLLFSVFKWIKASNDLFGNLYLNSVCFCATLCWSGCVLCTGPAVHWQSKIWRMWDRCQHSSQALLSLEHLSIYKTVNWSYLLSSWIYKSCLNESKQILNSSKNMGLWRILQEGGNEVVLSNLASRTVMSCR